MPKQKKPVARQTRRDERASARSHAALIASVDQSRPQAPKIARREPVKPLTNGQTLYDGAINGKSIIFGTGPAGTGKTWYSVQKACEALNSGEIDKIYVTRPAIEVGEGMGFLPGELDEKFDPYLTPLKEAFEDGMGSGAYEYALKNGRIEAIPLAFIRGRTIKNAWLIADEMQNATKTEFKALLTRIGENAKFIINGDASQIDEKIGRNSGLEDAVSRLGYHPEVGVVAFGRNEIVRSGLCRDVVEAYESD